MSNKCNKCNNLVCDCVNEAFVRKGPRGKQGPKGNTGVGVSVAGPQGIEGPTGPAGPSGVIGPTGLSAYQIWVSKGNIGTEQDFLNSLIGPPSQLPAVSVGTTTTLASGTPAYVNTTGSTASNSIFNFGIPTGPAGQKGDKGDKGEPGAPGANCLIFKNEAGAVVVPGSFRTQGGANFADVTTLQLSKTSMLGYSGSVATANNAADWLASIAIESVIQLTNVNDSTNFGIFKVGSKTNNALGVTLILDYIAGNGIANATNSTLTVCYNVPCIAEPANVNPDSICGDDTGGSGVPLPVPGSGCGCLPVGFLSPFAGAVGAPEGWLPADGSTKLISDYPALAAVLGTTYGPATTTTFKLPNANGRVIGGPGTYGSIGPGVIGAFKGVADITTSIEITVDGELGEAMLPLHRHGAGTLAAGPGGGHNHRLKVDNCTLCTSPNQGTTVDAKTDQYYNGDPYTVGNSDPNDKSGNVLEYAPNHVHPLTGETADAGSEGSPEPVSLSGTTSFDNSLIQPTLVMRWMIKF
jgi:microcystin-dependent protein